MSPLEHCRICQEDLFESLVDFGDVAQGGLFPKIGIEAPLLPLHLVRCVACGLVQLGDQLDPRQLYGDHYGYRSGLNSAMVEHLTDIVRKEVPRWVDLKPGDAVFDIGSNDGTLLNQYSPSLERSGIDPSFLSFADFYQPGMFIVHGFFGETASQDLAAPFKVVTSIAMFYDLDNPVGVAREVRKILADDGVWILEQGYWPELCRQGAYDVICHEHLDYYSLQDMIHIMDRAGLVIRDVSFNGVNGCSFRLVVSKQGTAFHMEPILALEAKASIESFIYRTAHHGEELKAFLGHLKSDGATIQGYGASTKGNTVLQHAGIGPDLLDCIVDVSEAKAGCWTPGTHIPIVLSAPTPDYYLVLPWHYRESILRREQPYLQQGGAFIFPLPAIEVVTRTGVTYV